VINFHRRKSQPKEMELSRLINDGFKACVIPQPPQLAIKDPVFRNSFQKARQEDHQ